MRPRVIALSVLSLATVAPVAQAQISITSPTFIYTQDFNSLASTGTNNTQLPAGFVINEEGSSTSTNNEAYNVNNGSTGTGDTYSFGGTGDSDRALGIIQSGSLQATFGVSFVNNSGVAINQFLLSYRGETWRIGGPNRSDRLDFAYSTNATSLTTGTYTDVDALDYNGPSVAAAITAARTDPFSTSAVTGGFSATLNPNQTLFLRFSDFNASLSDDGLAIDDLRLQVLQPVPAPPAAVSLAIGGSVGLLGTGVRRLRGRGAKRKHGAK
ncbi:MAG: hypothetical protein H7145_10785 [Akkermansiaceae bacterium]|nr:hypothetical protein [Armatimonadota bacterium]